MNEKQDIEQTKNSIKDTEATQSQQADYPDISKVDTKTIVIISFLFVLAIFLLSVFVPPASKQQASTEQKASIEQPDTASTTETTKSSETTEDSTALFDLGLADRTTELPEVMEAFRTFELEEPKPGFATFNGSTYYLTNNHARFTGWLMVDDASYLFRENGTMVTGWYIMDNHQYYFDEDGVMQTNQWVDGRYIGEDGYVLTNTMTPDGVYVGTDGTRNDSVSLETSVEGLPLLKGVLQSMTDGYSGTWSVYVKDIANNEYLVINNVQHFSASLIKLYCAAAAYDLMEKGTLERTENIDRLMAQMISISDNDAFNLMVMNCGENHSHIAGRKVIQEYIDKNGYKDTTITSILVPTRYRAPSSPGRNYTTVVDCGLLLEKIYKGKCVNPEISEEFLELLLNQTHINKIPRGLPEGTKCANKTGDTNETQHDAAIVYSPGGDYILCVMSSNCGNAINYITSISETVYSYFNSNYLIYESAD
ncbi:MAG: serine hydrolase [Bacteroidales bacterium]|nr:serine hydrolase [Clostridium sp.]MCM1204024.1 serine hydrolase [Bacteroidales bacterium]